MKPSWHEKVIVLTIVLISFLVYSPYFSPVLNSDCAVEVLMAENYSIDNCFYFWGQDRAGGLVPLLVYLINLFYKFNSLFLYSIIHYLIAYFGYMGYSRYINNHVNRIFLAIGLFLPPFIFSDVLWYTIGLEYSLLGIILGLIKTESGVFSEMEYRKLPFIIIISFIILWVSDSAIVPLTSIIIFYIYYMKFDSDKNNNNLLKITYFTASVVLSFLVLRYIKSELSATTQNYTSVNSVSQLLMALKTGLTSIQLYLTNQVGDGFLTIYSWLLFIFILSYIPLLIRIIGNGDRLAKFYLVTIFTLLTAVYFSNWVLLNGVGRRYFIGIYVLMLNMLLYSLDRMYYEPIEIKYRNTWRAGLLALMLIGFISTVYHYIQIDPGTLKARREYVEELDELGKIGIIAEYWNSYINGINAPSNIIATPHDKDNVRNLEYSIKAISMPRVFIIRDMWLDSFPDTIVQFNSTLVKSGDERFLAGSYICEYTKR